MPQVSQDSWVSTAMDSREVVKFVDGKGIFGVAGDDSAKKEEARKAARREKKKGYAKEARKREKQRKLEQLPRQLLALNGFCHMRYSYLLYMKNLVFIEE